MQKSPGKFFVITQVVVNVKLVASCVKDELNLKI